MIKFTTSNVPSFVIQDFLIDDNDTNQQVVGYLIQTDNGSIRIEEGDYIDDNSGKYTVYKASEYASSEIIKDLILDALNLTDAQELDIINRVLPVLVCLGDGFITRARKVMNSTTVTGQLTNGRKSAILAKIDTALTKI